MGKVDQKYIDLVYSSYGRVSLKTEFFDDFYDIFLASDPRIASMFAKTNFEKQKKLLQQGIAYMIMYVKDSHAGESAVSRIAEIHDRSHHKTDPELYPFWVDSLMIAVKKHDKEFSEELEDAWRKVIEPGIEYFISKY